MTREELTEIQRRVKFCIKRRIPVPYRTGQYYVDGMVLRYSERDGFYYTVILSDANRTNTSLTVGIEDVDFPNEGGGYKLD